VTKYVAVGVLTLQFVLPLPFSPATSTAQAGILEAVSGFFGIRASAAQDIAGTNSQKMPLLEAPLNPLATGSTELSPTAAAYIAEIATKVVVAQSLAAQSELENDTHDHGDDENHTITNYKVQSGDTVSGIAQKYGISINTILWANDLRRDSTLKAGQSLTILPISGVKHEVKSGDTLQGIALKYSGDAKEILAYNDLASDKLKIGDIVVVPDGELAATKAQSASNAVAKATTKVASAATGVKLAQAETSSSAYYTRPILAGTRTQGIHGSNGVDLADSCGTPIYAAAGGEVTLSKSGGGWNGGYGNYVVISHANGSQTLYAHMQGVSVLEGAQVAKGQAIGSIGNTGKVHGTTGCHLHFEIRGGGRNPF
jgi:murein DD-endopeptidase MepM/ murein hydrolase activator NlpD